METESKIDDTKEQEILTDHTIFHHSTIIGVILLIFAVTQMPLVVKELSNWNVKQNDCNKLCELQNICFDICDDTDTIHAAYGVMTTGLAFIIIFSVSSICRPAIDWLECNKNISIIGCIFMIAMIAGGLLYMIGYWILLDLILNLADDIIPFKWNNEDIFNWVLTVHFFQFWLGGSTAIIYGFECFFRILDEKPWKIFVFLSQLMLVSLVCFIGYTRIADFRHNRAYEIHGHNWQFPLIASGYLLILVSSILYCIFHKIKIHNLLMNMIAGLLVLGAFLAAIGYWGAFTSAADFAKNSFTTGYCLLLITLCSFCALYMWDSRLDRKIYDSVSKKEEE
eukprot:255973_1